MKSTCVYFFALVCYLIAVINAGFIHQSNTIGHEIPNYEFHYSVHDSATGDIKDQFEHRQGEYLTGRYSLIEPDGYRRIVEYRSDPITGFTAHVRREPQNFH